MGNVSRSGAGWASLELGFRQQKLHQSLNLLKHHEIATDAAQNLISQVFQRVFNSLFFHIVQSKLGLEKLHP